MAEANPEIIKKQFIIVKSLVINEKKQVLFVRRNKAELKQAHNKWEFPGGKIDFGETPEQTAVREAKEESGYDIEIVSLLPKLLSSKWVTPERESQQILICYICKLLGGKSNLNDHGVSEIKWFNLSEAPKDEDCLPGTVDFLNIYINSLKK
ncbi:MAG: NUDIX hydrolase [Candidatus Brocadiae bacterium]|nr:NUDIX hydrolase [Candidatus Brocadiia bacterium]